MPQIAEFVPRRCDSVCDILTWGQRWRKKTLTLHSSSCFSRAFWVHELLSQQVLEGFQIPSSRIVERFWVFNCTVLCKYCRGAGRGGRFRWTCWVWLWRGFPRSNGAPFSIPRTTGETFRCGRVQGKLVFSPCGRRRLTNEKKKYKHCHRNLVFIQPISHVATFRANAECW